VLLGGAEESVTRCTWGCGSVPRGCLCSSCCSARAALLFSDGSAILTGTAEALLDPSCVRFTIRRPDTGGRTVVAGCGSGSDGFVKTTYTGAVMFNVHGIKGQYHTFDSGFGFFLLRYTIRSRLGWRNPLAVVNVHSLEVLIKLWQVHAIFEAKIKRKESQQSVRRNVRHAIYSLASNLTECHQTLYRTP
jgi:hypothetical protein